MSVLDAEAVVLRLTGDLTALSAAATRQAFADVRSAGRLVIDLGDAGFIDSAGLGVLIGGIRRTRERGGRVAIASRSHRVDRLLTVTGLDRLIDVLPSVEDALARLEEPTDVDA